MFVGGGGLEFEFGCGEVVFFWCVFGWGDYLEFGFLVVRVVGRDGYGVYF